MSAPSERQMRFLEELQDLVGVSRLQVGDVVTAEDASVAIDRLLDMRDGGAPIRQATRAAVHAALRDLGIDKAIAYAGAGVVTLAEGAVERDGRRVLAWLQLQRVEVVVRPAAPPRTVDGCRIIPGRAVVRPVAPTPLVETQAPSQPATGVPPGFRAGYRAPRPPRAPKCTPGFVRAFGAEAARPWVPVMA